MNKITLGADTEFFLTDKNGNIIPSVGLIGGTKKDPIPISQILETSTYDRFMIQEDNVLAEINVPVANDAKEFETILQLKSFVIRDVCRKFSTGNYMSIKSLHSYHFFKPEQLLSEQAQTFGCDPDFNAWTGKMNESPKVKSNMRTAGFHIHIGYENSTMEKNMEIIKFMDMIFGINTIRKNTQQMRMFMYGKMGAFRHKPYGVEYRFLDSGYLKRFIDNYNTHQPFFTAIQNIVTLVSEGKTVEKVFTEESIKKITDCILFNDVKYAKEVMFYSIGDYERTVREIIQSSVLENYLRTT